MIKVKDLEINYEVSGKGKDIILLHGWGQNTLMMKYVADFLKAHFRVYNIDFPGFGKSEEPKVAWSNDDYVSFLHKFVEKKKIENPIIIGHSFGCRVALMYAYK